MTPAKSDASPSRAQDSSPGAQATPLAETPGRSDAVVAETRPVSVRTAGADPMDPSIRAPIVGESPLTGGHAVTPAPRTDSVQQKFDLLWQIITGMEREMRERVLPSPTTENGASNLEDPSKPELDLIPVHALRAGSDDIHEMAKGIPSIGDINSTHQLVGVVTRGQSLTVADEAAAPLSPAQAEDTLRASTVITTAINDTRSASVHVSLDQAIDEILEQEYRRRYIHGRSTANRSFNKDEYYARALSKDPPACSDSAASTPTWFTPGFTQVRQENCNLLQHSRVVASGVPDYGSVPMINRQALFHIGMQEGSRIEACDANPNFHVRFS